MRGRSLTLPLLLLTAESTLVYDVIARIFNSGSHGGDGADVPPPPPYCASQLAPSFITPTSPQTLGHPGSPRLLEPE
jgi:hypothetical protein